MARAAKRAMKTPVRAALTDASPLQAKVCDGMGAVKKEERGLFADDARRAFADSLDLDEAVRPGHGGENRWDYLLGHEASGEVIAVEPHSAKQDEVRAVIRKRAAAKEQLRPHLREGARITRWLWVASGAVHFANTERTRLALDQHGIEFVGKRVTSKHLPKGK